MGLVVMLVLVIVMWFVLGLIRWLIVFSSVDLFEFEVLISVMKL